MRARVVVVLETSLGRFLERSRPAARQSRETVPRVAGRPTPKNFSCRTPRSRRRTLRGVRRVLTCHPSAMFARSCRRPSRHPRAEPLGRGTFTLMGSFPTSSEHRPGPASPDVRRARHVFARLKVRSRGFRRERWRRRPHRQRRREGWVAAHCSAVPRAPWEPASSVWNPAPRRLDDRRSSSCRCGGCAYAMAPLMRVDQALLDEYDVERNPQQDALFAKGMNSAASGLWMAVAERKKDLFARLFARLPADGEATVVEVGMGTFPNAPFYFEPAVYDCMLPFEMLGSDTLCEKRRSAPSGRSSPARPRGRRSERCHGEFARQPQQGVE